MHKPIAIANALAVVGGLSYVICAVWILLSRSTFLGIMNGWVHGIDMNALPQKTPDIITLAIGFVTFTLFAWISGYAFSVTYNYFVKK